VTYIAHRTGITNNIDKEIARMENTKYTSFLLDFLADIYIQEFFDYPLPHPDVPLIIFFKFWGAIRIQNS
jgi:hypothetical protein